MTTILWYFFRKFGFGSQPPTSSQPTALVRFGPRDNVARFPARDNVSRFGPRANTAAFPTRGAE